MRIARGYGEKMMDYKSLIKKAMQASERAYSPYSHFKVGAVLVAKDGREYEGANIENASFSVTNCAERVALGKAIFAVGCGIITFVIRKFGSLPEGVSYSILLMNILTRN